MEIYVTQCSGTTASCSCDEYGERTDNLTDNNGRRTTHGMMHVQYRYLISVHGVFRDRLFEQTLKEFSNWLCRLSRSMWVDKVLVKVYDDMGRSYVFDDVMENYLNMYEPDRRKTREVLYD